MSPEEHARQAAREIYEDDFDTTFCAREIAIILRHIEEALREREQELVDAAIKRIALGWSAAKEMRDGLCQLSDTAERRLEEMQQLGMDAHLPTFDEMCGFLHKSDGELRADEAAARERMRTILLGLPAPPAERPKEEKP